MPGPKSATQGLGPHHSLNYTPPKATPSPKAKGKKLPPSIFSPAHPKSLGHVNRQDPLKNLAPTRGPQPNGVHGVPRSHARLASGIAHGFTHAADVTYHASPLPSAFDAIAHPGNTALQKRDIKRQAKDFSSVAEATTGYREIKHIRQHPIAGGIALGSDIIPGFGKLGRGMELAVEAARAADAAKGALTAEDVVRATEQASHAAEGTTGLKRIAANRKVAKISRLKIDPASAHADYARRVDEANQRAFARQDVPRLEEGQVSPETGGEAGGQIRSAMTGAERDYSRQKKLQRAELRTRVAKLSASEKKATSLTELAHAPGLGGKYSTLPFEGFKGLEPLQQGIKEHIDQLPMSVLDKRKLAGAIVNGINGNVPKPFERKLIERAFGKLAAEKVAAAAPGIGHNIVDILNIPRAFKTAGDFSWGLRQGLVALTYRPSLWAKELGPMFHSAISEAETTKRMAAIHADPETALGMEHGLAITDPNKAGGLGSGEEGFQSQMAERLHELPGIRSTPGVKHVAKGVSTIVRASDRAYVVPLNEIRLNLFKHLTQLAADNGHHLNDQLLHDIADIVNTFTGRGNLGPKLAEHRATINAVFFSPGLMKARINMLNPAHYYRLEPFARQQQLKAARNLAGSIGMTLYLAHLAGAQVVTDPRSADFGKIKKGDTRLDIGGGIQQYVRLGAILATQQTVSSTTQKVSPLTGHYGGQSDWDVIQNFFTNKTSPVLSEGISLAKQNRFGQPLTVKGEFANTFAPLLGSDIYDLNRAAGPGAAAAYGFPDIFGVGVQNYPAGKKKKSKAPKGGYSSGGGYAGSGDYSGSTGYSGGTGYGP